MPVIITPENASNGRSPGNLRVGKTNGSELKKGVRNAPPNVTARSRRTTLSLGNHPGRMVVPVCACAPPLAAPLLTCMCRPRAKIANTTLNTGMVCLVSGGRSGKSMPTCGGKIR